MSCTHPNRINAPVPADVGEEVVRRGLLRGQAGDVEDGLGAGVPLSFLLVRGVALDQDGLGRVLEAGVLRREVTEKRGILLSRR